MLDMLNRPLRLGDLVITYKKGKKVLFDIQYLDYAIIVGEERAFNGFHEYKICLACIAPDTEANQKRKHELSKKYTELISPKS